MHLEVCHAVNVITCAVISLCHAVPRLSRPSAHAGFARAIDSPGLTSTEPDFFWAWGGWKATRSGGHRAGAELPESGGRVSSPGSRIPTPATRLQEPVFP